MSNQNEQNKFIQELLIPETALERAFLSDDDYLRGLFWGKPRYGHPEGKIILHIREVLNNVDRIPNLDSDTREKLRIITFVHDIFKYKEHDLRKTHGYQNDNHHAFLASIFLDNYIDDKQLVALVRLHDEAYYSWKLLRYDQLEASQNKLAKLIADVGDYLQLYYLFFKCDTRTGDKTQEPLLWFEQEVKEIDIVNF